MRLPLCKIPPVVTIFALLPAIGGCEDNAMTGTDHKQLGEATVLQPHPQMVYKEILFCAEILRGGCIVRGQNTGVFFDQRALGQLLKASLVIINPSMKLTSLQ